MSIATRSGHIARAVVRAKVQITYDIEVGVVPSTVSSFAELHDYVDANEYGAVPAGSGRFVRLDVDMLNEVQERLDAWLKEGRP